MQQRICGLLLSVFMLWFPDVGDLTPQAFASATSSAATTSSPFPIMQAAFTQTLQLQFTQALETAASLEEPPYPALALRLTRGMIAYFQWRWQTPASLTSQKTGHTLLQEVLEAGQQRLTAAPRDAQLLLFVGLAAAFDALLQQGQDAWQSFQLFAQAKTWLEQALVTDSSTTDAHLGLGVLYFAGADLSPWLRRLWERMGGLSTESTIHHLQQAAARAHFTKQVASTFLARLYLLEQRYTEALALGQMLQEAFPDNGYYALLTGRCQCAQRQYDACAKTLVALASRHQVAANPFTHKEDRLEMYYYLGVAHNEIAQYDEAFEALRQAINEDPSNTYAESLWAKYHLATLYERRGQPSTARQIYRTLLRGRNVDDLHRRVQQRLAQMQ